MFVTASNNPYFEGRFARRRRHIILACLILTLLFHGGLCVYTVRILIASALAPAHLSAAKLKKKKKKRKPLDFVVVDEEEDEKIDPSLAIAQAAVTRAARDLKADPKLNKGGPKETARSIAMSAMHNNSRRMTRAVKPQPASNQSAKKQTAEDKRDPAKTEKEKMQEDPNGWFPKRVAEKSGKEARKSPAKKPTFQVVGSKASPPPKRFQSQHRLSANLTGTPSMQLLRRRWGEYCNILVRKINQSFIRQFSFSQSSYKAGMVQIHFAISPDGSIYDIKPLYARADMLAEKNGCLATIEDAGPFPPLTKEMQKDPTFKNINVTFVLH